jgi:pimeloyl-ACP methyl ester carboxylesterase
MDREVAGVNVHYEEKGAGRPMVMLHGWPMDHTQMTFEMEPHFEHRRGWRRIYPDLPGFGGTPGPDWIRDNDQMLEFLLKFIDSVIPGERFVAAGTSYGAYLARGLVHRRGRDMDGLLLSVPLITPRSEAVASPPGEPLPARQVLVRDEAFTSAARDGGYGWLEELGVVLDSRLMDYAKVLQAAPDGDKAFQARLRKKNAFSFDVDHLETPFPAPTLFLLGRQDSVLGYRDAWGVIENYPRATFAVLDRAGHLMWGEQRGLASALTGDWLDRVEEWRPARRSASEGESGPRRPS